MVQTQYQSGTQASNALTGTERIAIDNGGAVSATCTTAQIAQLATQEGDLSEVAITTVGNGTLTAAGLAAGQIARSGPVAAYTDTTATAAQIVAALPAFVSGATFVVRIKNATAFVQTLAAGAGVTLPATLINSPFSFYQMFGTIGGTAAVPTVTFTHMGSTTIADAITATVPLATALTTVGAGTITAAGINGGFTIRGGAQTNAAFIDTTDTAANIIAGNPGLVNKIGTSFLYLYQNNTNATATLTGGTGVTVSGITAVPANASALYLVTYTAAGTITMVGVMQSNPNTANGTFVANGAAAVVVADTRVTANSVIDFGLKTIGGTPAGAPFMSAVTAGTGFSVKVAAGDTSTYNYRIVG